MLDLAVSISSYFVLVEMDLGRKYAHRSTPPYCPATPAAPIPPCPPVSPYSVWPREWPMPPLRPLEPDPPKPPERAPFAVRLGVAAWPELVASGWGSFGFSAEVGARYRFVSLGVEAHGDPPLGSVQYPSVGAVSFARISGALLPCVHVGWFAGCGVIDAGRFLFPNHVPLLPASALYAAAGVRVKLEFPIVPSRLFVDVALDLRAPIEPLKRTGAGATIFESAGPGVGLGLGVHVEFPR